MPALRAEELLREKGGELSADALREAVLAATGDEKAADDLWARRALEETRPT